MTSNMQNWVYHSDISLIEQFRDMLEYGLRIDYEVQHIHDEVHFCVGKTGEIHLCWGKNATTTETYEFDNLVELLDKRL